MSNVLTWAEILAGLAGRGPAPFTPGRRVELVMATGRLVRGVVLQAGGAVAQVQVGIVPSWVDDRGTEREAYPHIALIVYAQVRRWRDPAATAPDGNWNPGRPGYATALVASSGDWHEWPS